MSQGCTVVQRSIMTARRVWRKSVYTPRGRVIGIGHQLLMLQTRRRVLCVLLVHAAIQNFVAKNRRVPWTIIYYIIRVPRISLRFCILYVVVLFSISMSPGERRAGRRIYIYIYLNKFHHYYTLSLRV